MRTVFRSRPLWLTPSSDKLRTCLRGRDPEKMGGTRILIQLFRIRLQKLPTLVQPLAYDQAGYSDPSDKNGVTLNIHALTAFRQALAGGAYAGAFAGPHRAPLYPQVRPSNAIR